MSLPKKIKYTETEKSHVWNIGRLQKFHAVTKSPMSHGRNLLLRQSKQHKNRLYFSNPGFRFKNKVAEGQGAEESMVFSIKNGKLQLYRVNREDKSVRNINLKTHKIPVEKKEHCRRFLHVLRNFLKENNYEHLPKCRVKEGKDFQEQLLYCLYPGLRSLRVTVGLDKLFCKVFRNKVGLKDAAKFATGSKGKKTTKLIAAQIEDGKSLGVFRIVVIKGLVPLEIIQEVIENKAYNCLTVHKDLRKFLKEFSVEKRISLIRDFGINYRIYTIRDTIEAWNLLKEKQANVTIPDNIKTTWHGLHDYLYKEAQKIKNPPVEITYSDEMLEIDNFILDDMRIELPKDTYVLIDYGQKLSNCVGMYGYRITNKQCEIVGIYKNEELKYCIEIAQNEIKQFSGFGNSLNETEEQRVERIKDKEKFTALLKEKKII